MRAIKIDVKQQKVYVVKYTPTLECMNELLELNDRPFTSVYTRQNGDVLFVDDEGLLIKDPIGAFGCLEYPQVLSGHGLFIGMDFEGKEKSCVSSVEEIQELIRFFPIQVLAAIPRQHNIIPLTNSEMIHFLHTGELPLGKVPTNPN